MALTRQLAANPQGILERLAETALELCRAHSAGFSLLSQGGKRLSWTAVVGQWADHAGGGTPREFGPCGLVLDHDAPLLFWHPEERFPYLAATTPCIDEGLLLPFYAAGKAVGTIWVIAHDASRRFDAEDLRVMTNLAAFSSAAYQTLCDSEHRFRAILDALPAAVYTTDAEGWITHCNRAATEIIGRTPQIGIDRWCVSWKVFTPDGTPLPYDQGFMARAVKTGQALKDVEVVLERPDGTRIPAASYPTPLRADDGRVVGGLNMLVDITARKQAESTLARLVAQLRDEDRRKDEFLATLAHELRNPLAPIANSLQLMQRSSGDPEKLQQARRMAERQLQHLVRLVDDLLDVSRITHDQLELRKQRVELAAVVNSAVETSRPWLDKHGHELELSLPPAPVVLEIDAVRIAQALSNLLNNAAKYSEPGRRIRLIAEHEGGAVTLRVCDQGMGIPPEMLTRIFEMFVQVDRSLDRSQGGLGIGLTLVKRIVEMHGGSVEARSEGLDRGSELAVRLPCVVATTSATAAARAGDRAAAAAGRRILIVDDNQDAADSLAEMLQILGHEVATAHDGLQALEVAAAFRPDIAVLDLGLPKLDGYEVARRIREQHEDTHPLLVALTGWGQEADRRRSREAGFDLHLVKPIKPSRLDKLIRSATSTGEGGPPAEPPGARSR